MELTTSRKIGIVRFWAAPEINRVQRPSLCRTSILAPCMVVGRGFMFAPFPMLVNLYSIFSTYILRQMIIRRRLGFGSIIQNSNQLLRVKIAPHNKGLGLRLSELANRIRPPFLISYIESSMYSYRVYVPCLVSLTFERKQVNWVWTNELEKVTAESVGIMECELPRNTQVVCGLNEENPCHGIWRHRSNAVKPCKLLLFTEEVSAPDGSKFAANTAISHVAKSLYEGHELEVGKLFEFDAEKFKDDPKLTETKDGITWFRRIACLTAYFMHERGRGQRPDMLRFVTDGVKREVAVLKNRLFNIVKKEWEVYRLSGAIWQPLRTDLEVFGRNMY